MKFKFDKNLEYQKEAMNAVVDLFDTGKNFAAKNNFKLQLQGSVVSNEMEIDKDRIFKNLISIQKRNNVTPISEKLDGMDFTVEMETGTGKTYVYLRTILELANTYGLKKFIILVPSVAIREGVFKTIEQTKDHFREIYGNLFSYFAYDSAKLSQVRDFVNGIDTRIMVMTIQSFNSDTKVMRQTPDRFNGESPLSLVAKTKPIIIMDEPQNMGSNLSKSAIYDLNPLFKLRYSATHKELYNLIYKLTPIDAYKMGLVKKIQVWGVHEDNPNEFIFKVKEIVSQLNSGPKARVTLEIKSADDNYNYKELWLKAGDNLFRKTNNSKYNESFISEISASANYVETSDDRRYKIEDEIIDKEIIFRTQINQTIKAHVDKKNQLESKIKVLSLFFIDKVDNYIHPNSLIRRIFEEEYEKITGQSAQGIHDGYFAKKKEKGETIEIDTKGDSKADKEIYDLIMKNKEKLLSFKEPLEFIFSHSALKEGWDNPNIFQICTLRETNSLMKKRQEIGRGLRLPVNINGDRMYDTNINVLTVIANESYRDYVSGLQQEFNDSGYINSPIPDNARAKRILVKTTKYLEDKYFLELWKKISQKTKFSLSINTQKLIETTSKRINEMDIRSLVVRIEKVDLYFDKNKVKYTISSQAIGGKIQTIKNTLDNFVYRISLETGITKKTILEILLQLTNIDIFFENPEEYTRSCVVIIKSVLNELLSNEGLKYEPTGKNWELKSLFSEFEALESKIIKTDKSPYEYTIFDSDGERQFALALQNNSNVKIFTKLPQGFSVDTPIGQYIPDWAIVWHDEKGVFLYLVRETKFGYQDLSQDLSMTELQKIIFGKKHFEAIRVNFKVSENVELLDLN